MSPSSQRAWIEIPTTKLLTLCFAVALLAEGVDRNETYSSMVLVILMSPSSQRAWIEIVCRRPRLKAVIVALLAEGVDRNLRPAVEDHIDEVALLAEGVDRNIQLRRSVLIPASSPSSQRAWIEMHL